MLTKIIMPSGGQNTDESLLVKWHKDIGDEVRKGDVLFEIETDKANMEIESFADGILLSKYHDEGEYVMSGDTVAYIGQRDDAVPLQEEKKEEATADAPGMKKRVAAAVDEKGGRGVKASPAAKKLARDAGITISEIAGQTADAMIKKADVESYIGGMAGQAGYYYTETSRARKTIAERMSESVSSIPQYSVSVEIDMTQAVKFRENMNIALAGKGVRLSFNDILMKCASKAIEKYPFINSTYGSDRIKVYKNVDFGLAISLPDGLVAAVVKDTDKKTLGQIAAGNAENIAKASQGRLKPEDIQGGTITLSNLGMYGASSFTAIINPPESCILAVGCIREQISMVGGCPVPRKMMTVTATFDHRVIDGAYGAMFLKEFKQIVENVISLLV